MTSAVPFEDLATADLYVDCVYEGGTVGNAGDDPLNRLLPVGNQGGFRFEGSVRGGTLRMVVLHTTGEDRHWPDSIDLATGTVTYFGDNKTPGQALHSTSKEGNELLSVLFKRAHTDAASRAQVPPIFIFRKATKGRDVIFRGLGAPGSPSAAPGEDLVALWRVANRKRFQNYRATFTLFNEPLIRWEWIVDIGNGETLTERCLASLASVGGLRRIRGVDRRADRHPVASRTDTDRSRREGDPGADPPLLQHRAKGLSADMRSSP